LSISARPVFRVKGISVIGPPSLGLTAVRHTRTLLHAVHQLYNRHRNSRISSHTVCCHPLDCGMQFKDHDHCRGEYTPGEMAARQSGLSYCGRAKSVIIIVFLYGITK
jgi:hypothetical protein